MQACGGQIRPRGVIANAAAISANGSGRLSACLLHPTSPRGPDHGRLPLVLGNPRRDPEEGEHEHGDPHTAALVLGNLKRDPEWPRACWDEIGTLKGKFNRIAKDWALRRSFEGLRCCAVSLVAAPSSDGPTWTSARRC